MGDLPEKDKGGCCRKKLRRKRQPVSTDSKHESPLPFPMLGDNPEEVEKEEENVAVQNLLSLFRGQKPKLDDREMFKLRDVVDL